MSRRITFFGSLIVALVLCAAFTNIFSGWAFALTGEENVAGQVRGIFQLAGRALRPYPKLRASVDISTAHVNPFGVNTFLEQEVEQYKRQLQVRLIADAGFHWIRQEFPWYDIEVHAKDDFEDRRTDPHRGSWEKYDHIVSLSDDEGLEIIARLSSPPQWAQSGEQVDGVFAPPASNQDFVDFAVAVTKRYQGRVEHYQIWNEPNIYPEWGEQAVSPEAYTELLCLAYDGIKTANPNAYVLSAALAPTSSLTARDLNDYIFLERMYLAGARECFDIMSAQGYGLWSGPTDHRLQPATANYGRIQYIRDLMVAHRDAAKSIWISEMNWNAVPENSGLAPIYGRVSLEQQARWAPLAYDRARKSWPWIGVINLWYFKRADASEKGQSWYYFRMVEPDFSLMPIYDAMKSYIHTYPYEAVISD